MVDPDVYDPSPITAQGLMNNSMAVIGSVFTPHSMSVNRVTLNSRANWFIGQAGGNSGD